jgi:tRNA pseudouridine65 synthase
LIFEILFRDENLVVINKPHGVVVHRSSYVGEADIYAVQELRKQLGQYVYPCHRIDRKTSGILVFTLNQESARRMQELFAGNFIKKNYLAIVRGYTDDLGVIDYTLINEKGKSQEALTNYKTIKRVELDIPFGKFKTSRYSLVDAEPHTGRMHQIRKHLAHIHHPIIGDRPHGCNKQNRLFKELFQMDTMMLHAHKILFSHPESGKEIKLKASLHTEFQRMIDTLQFGSF